MGAGDYSLRPNFKQKFRPTAVAGIINKVLLTHLNGTTYQPEHSSQLTKEIADEIKQKVKALALDRYKIIVNVVLGEMRGEGVRMGSRCLWDADSDNMAQDVFMNESLFCAAVVFGVYFY